MATYFLTHQGKNLLGAFDAKISQTDATGKITTWEKIEHSNTIYYTHKASAWRNAAFFLPTIERDRLTFNIIKPKEKVISIEVYGYYHGHLIETFLNHFDQAFSDAAASARPLAGDVIV